MLRAYLRMEPIVGNQNMAPLPITKIMDRMFSWLASDLSPYGSSGHFIAYSCIFFALICFILLVKTLGNIKNWKIIRCKPNKGHCSFFHAKN